MVLVVSLLGVEEDVTLVVAVVVIDNEVRVAEGDADCELGGVGDLEDGGLVFPITSQGWFISINTGRPSIKSCLELATTRLLSWVPLRANTLVVSTTFITIDCTPIPFASGQNLRSEPTLSPIAHALCGSTTEYMILSGHVFSISRVCWYSRASSVKDRSKGTEITHWRLCARSGRTTSARSL